MHFLGHTSELVGMFLRNVLWGFGENALPAPPATTGSTSTPAVGSGLASGPSAPPRSTASHAFGQRRQEGPPASGAPTASARSTPPRTFPLLAFALSAALPLSGADFTRESALAQAQKTHPSAALPSDELPTGVIATENVVYASPAGTPLALDLYRPDTGKLHPAVLVIHGGGWDAGSRAMERPFAKRLAAAGFVAVTVSYRVGEAGRFPAALHDLKAAVRWLRAHADQHGIDPARIGAVGGSAGGQLAALLGATNGVASLEGESSDGRANRPSVPLPPPVSSTVQAVVDIDGLADFTAETLVTQQNAKPSAPSRFLGGSFAERADVWREASPITHVGPASAATLFLNSTVTNPILPGRAEMAAKLHALGLRAEVIVFPDTPHTFWLLQPWQDRVVSTTVEFLRRELAPCPASIGR